MQDLVEGLKREGSWGPLKRLKQAVGQLLSKGNGQRLLSPGPARPCQVLDLTSKDKLLAQVLTVLTSVWTSFFTSECLLVLWRYGLNPWPCVFYESCVPLNSIAQLPSSLVLNRRSAAAFAGRKRGSVWLNVCTRTCVLCMWVNVHMCAHACGSPRLMLIPGCSPIFFEKEPH